MLAARERRYALRAAIDGSVFMCALALLSAVRTGGAAAATALVNDRIFRPPAPSTYSPPRGPR